MNDPQIYPADEIVLCKICQEETHPKKYLTCVWCRPKLLALIYDGTIRKILSGELKLSENRL